MYWYKESFTQAFLLTGTATRVSYVINGPLDFVKNEELGWGKRLERHFVQQSMQIIFIDKQNR